MRWQVEHSNVRSSKPLSPGEIRPNPILCLQVGHDGRSITEMGTRTTQTPGTEPDINVCRGRGKGNAANRTRALGNVHRPARTSRGGPPHHNSNHRLAEGAPRNESGVRQAFQFIAADKAAGARATTGITTKEKSLVMRKWFEIREPKSRLLPVRLCIEEFRS
jgi:hypothetical protein